MKTRALAPRTMRSYRLSFEACRKLESMARAGGISRTAVLEGLIREGWQRARESKRAA